MFKVNNRNTWKRFELSSNLTRKTVEQRRWRRSDVFYCYLWTYSTPFPVSIINVEPVNVSWVNTYLSVSKDNFLCGYIHFSCNLNSFVWNIHGCFIYFIPLFSKCYFNSTFYFWVFWFHVVCTCHNFLSHFWDLLLCIKNLEDKDVLTFEALIKEAISWSCSVIL